MNSKYKDIRDEIYDVVQSLRDVEKQKYDSIGIENETIQIQKKDKDNYEIRGTIKTTGKNVLVRINVTRGELDVEKLDRSDDEIIDDFTENFATYLVSIYKDNILNLEKLVLSDGDTNNFVSNRINDKEDIKKIIKEAILRLKETKIITIDNLKNYQSQEAYFDTILFMIKHDVGSQGTRGINFDELKPDDVRRIKEDNINYSSISKLGRTDMLKRRLREESGFKKLRYEEILKNIQHHDISENQSYPKFKETVLWKIFNDANSNSSWSWFGGNPKKSKSKKSKKAKKSKKSKKTRKTKK